MLTIKTKFLDDIRRVSVDSLPSYDALRHVLVQLYGSNLPSNFVIKYSDPEGDLVTIASDMELLEARKFAATSSILRLTLVAPGSSNANRVPINENASLENLFSLLGLGGNIEKLDLSKLFDQFMQNPVIKELLPHLVSTFNAFPNVVNPNNNINDVNGKDSGSNSRCSKNNNCNTKSESPEVHYGVSCDSCFRSPIVGARNKCKVCPDYDLCDLCLLKNVHNHHSFVKIPRSRRNPHRWWGNEGRESNKSVHWGVTCDQCETRHISGVRHKCNVCDDYDLCDTCFVNAASVHDATHTFSSIETRVRRCPRWQGCGAMRNVQRGQSQHEKQPQHPAPLAAKFLSHVSIEDNTVLQPRVPFIKSWRMRNVGAEWPANCSLCLVEGDAMGALAAQYVPLAVPSGAEVDLEVEMIAPEAEGRYIGYWQLVDSAGSNFGDRVKVEIVVQVLEVPEELKEEPIVEPVEDIQKSETVEDIQKSAPLVEEVKSEPLVQVEEMMNKENVEEVKEILDNQDDILSSLRLRATDVELEGLAHLEAMGFNNKIRNLVILRSNKGDFEAALNELLQSE